LPRTFDTPMFWNESDLEELKGSSVVGSSAYCLVCSRRFSTCGLFIEKIGKEDAEKDYYEKLLPAISVRSCWLIYEVVVYFSYYASDSNRFVPGALE
jgi:SET domain-containing protein 6